MHYEKKRGQNRRFYSSEVKKQAIELAKELGPKQAAEELGISNFQTLSRGVTSVRTWHTTSPNWSTPASLGVYAKILYRGILSGKG